MVLDPNNDGRIEPHEFAEVATDKRYAARNHGRSVQLEFADTLVGFDPNKDGKLTELEAMGILSEALAGLKQNIPPRRANSHDRRLENPKCKAKPASADAKIISIGSYHGSAIPSVTVAGQDRKTSTSSVYIEKGDKPLYLVATSLYPMIWRLQGATDRVQHMVVAGTRHRGEKKIPAGVTGLDRSKITFLPQHECLPYFLKPNSIKAAQAASLAGKLAGRKVDQIVAEHTIHRLYLPSGNRVAAARKNVGFDIVTDRVIDPRNPQDATPSSAPIAALKSVGKKWRNLQRELITFTKGGIVDVPLRLVASDGEPEVYEVLPQEAGLLQLVATGALEIVGRREFRILKKIRLPSNMGGGHAARFLLKAGVPEPEGKPVHSCVFSEDKGAFVNSASHC
ncbi:MAG: hypothetical protein GY947_12435 [Rhodobacteraceae bacterium]|nr:hypothetical protein [Paracoccaceae bacterium]